MIRHPRRIIRAVTAGLMLCLLAGTLCVYGQAQGVRREVVRLHILAHSDSTADQTLKLAVRDAVVDATAGWLDDTADTDAALTMLERRLPEIEAVARQTVQKAGYDYPVTAEIDRLYFTTRQYDTVTLPAGMYHAVQLTIGSGRGQNWWCVVYPPLCTGAAADREALSQVLDPAGQNLVTGGGRYKIRFQIVEWVESLLQIFRTIGTEKK